MTQTSIYTVFHLNLAFSSVELSQHADIVKRCYWPLLRLAESGIPLGIEMTAYTLESINQVDKHWVSTFRELLHKNKCELIASGDSQIIGPLIPAIVNSHNLRIGQKTYFDLLKYTPKIAYLNEQSVSAGLLDIYIDAGFEAVVVEWDNPYSHNPEWSSDLLEKPQQLISATGRTIKVIWNHAIGFQKFQFYVHRDLTLDDYLNYLIKVRKSSSIAFPVYGSDAEVFDFRPGRYQSEAKIIDGEWDRIKVLFDALNASDVYQWVLPCKLLNESTSFIESLYITNSQHPISVKKQAKYNITRWAVSGRNDLLLNTICHQNLNELKNKKNVTDEEWKKLCRLWASDLRTHLTQSRYDLLPIKASEKITTLNVSSWQDHEDIIFEFDEERNKLQVKTKHIQLLLNGNRGLAIEKLAFISHNFTPIIGTLSHGYFDHISYGADFYSNHLIIERFRHRDRVTDLNKVQYELGKENGSGDLIVYCHQYLKTGKVTKYYRFNNEKLYCGIIFDDKTRPEASIRLGFNTLLDCSERAWYGTHLGSFSEEKFVLNDDIDQGKPVSSIVSANSGLGATESTLNFGSGCFGINLSWDPASCAALPMISSKKIDEQYLNRVWFSLCEADETLKENGSILDFEYSITPILRETFHE